MRIQLESQQRSWIAVCLLCALIGYCVGAFLHGGSSTRFETLRGNKEMMLDRKTGTLCRTVPWKDPYYGALPTCQSLYYKH